MVVSEGKPPEASSSSSSSAIASVATTTSECYSMNAVAVSEQDCCSDDMENFGLLERASVLSTPRCTCYLLHDFLPVSGLHASDKWISLAETLKQFGEEWATMETSTEGSEQQQQDSSSSSSSSRLHLVLHSGRLVLQPGGPDIHLLSLLVKKATEHLLAEMKRECSSKQSPGSKQH